MGAMLAASIVAGSPATAAVDCLTDAELTLIVRSVFTRSIGRVMRACATRHPSLDDRARDATTAFLTVYAEEMRRNRLAANSVMARAQGEGWEAVFDKILLETTASDEMRARSASREECEAEIDRVDSMVAADDYGAVMDENAPRRISDLERDLFARCD